MVHLPCAANLVCDCGSVEFGRPDRDHKPWCLTTTESWVIHAPPGHLVRFYYPPPRVQRFTSHDALVAFLCAHGSSSRCCEIIHVETKHEGQVVTYQLGEHGPYYYVEFGPHWSARVRLRKVA